MRDAIKRNQAQSAYMQACEQSRRFGAGLGEDGRRQHGAKDGQPVH